MDKSTKKSIKKTLGRNQKLISFDDIGPFFIESKVKVFTVSKCPKGMIDKYIAYFESKFPNKKFDYLIRSQGDGYIIKATEITKC